MSTYDADEAVTVSDDEGFQINDEIDVGDLSDQQGGTIEPASRIAFEVKKASVRTQIDKPSGLWTVRRLALEVAIGPLGVDGEGKYANKRIFPDLILVMNTKDFPEKFSKDWWQREARFPTKQFFKALDIDITSIRVNDEFLAGLIGREFVADIKKREQQEQLNGKWVGTGDYRNELANYRAPASNEASA